MRNKLNLIAITAAFVIGIGFNNIANSALPSKIAVVDIGKVVSQSQQVSALKKEQKQKNDELNKWLQTVRADVNKQTTEEAKKKLTQKYDAELAKKRTAIKKNYSDKLQAIDASISKTIANEATAKGYTIVLTKNAVLYGGDDITDSIAKVVK